MFFVGGSCGCGGKESFEVVGIGVVVLWWISFIWKI